MSAYSVTRICGYIVFTGGGIALGLAAGQLGLVIAGIVLLFWSWLLFTECRDIKIREEVERSAAPPET